MIFEICPINIRKEFGTKLEISININKADFSLMNLMPACCFVMLRSFYPELINSRNDK